ncbi:MAG: hypothetical protein CMC70_09865 [Flavobacteriaceae bacterium]|nr:hypothetical protein [Flavobacteriaceae bacterium]
MKLKLSIYICLFLACTLSAQSQKGNGNENSKSKQEVVKKQKENKNKNKFQKDRNDDDGVYKSNDDYNKKNKKKSNNGKGNAYGKHKYGLEGRAFGQERARQAKLKNKTHTQRLQERVVLIESRLPTLRERIINARRILLEQKPTLSIEVYDRRNAKLVLAERKMTDLEKMLLLAKKY